MKSSTGRSSSPVAGAVGNRRILGDYDHGLSTESTLWFAAPAVPSDSSALHLGWAEAGRVAESLVVSNVVPEWAPSGGLVAATVITDGGRSVSAESVRADLSAVYGVSCDDWKLLRLGHTRSDGARG